MGASGDISGSAQRVAGDLMAVGVQQVANAQAEGILKPGRGLCRYHGRKRDMMYAGIAFMIAAILLCAAEHIAMIVIGRILQGIAVRPCLLPSVLYSPLQREWWTAYLSST